MKKTLAILLVFSLFLSCPAALAADKPFKAGVNYGLSYDDNGAVPSMLNFGSATLAPGESFEDAKKTTIKKMSATSIVKSLDKLDYYCYAKWQCSDSFDYYYVDAMLVMTSPTREYYAVYDSHEFYDGAPNGMYYWYFNVTDCLNRCIEDNNGSLPKGEYSFSLFLNDMSFRVSKVKCR